MYESSDTSSARCCVCQQNTEPNSHGTFTFEPAIFGVANPDTNLFFDDFGVGSCVANSDAREYVMATIFVGSSYSLRLDYAIVPTGRPFVPCDFTTGPEYASEDDISDWTCDETGFSVTWGINEENAPTFAAMGLSSVTYEAPYAYPRCCAVTFVPNGCNGHALTQPSTATIWSDSSKTTMIGSNSAVQPMVFLHESGDYYYEVTHPGMDTFSETHTFTCGRGLRSSITLGVPMTPALGFYCLDESISCGESFPGTLHATSSTHASFTLTYDGFGSLGPGWYALFDYSYPGCLCACESSSVLVTVFLSTNLVYTEFWNST